MRYNQENILKAFTIYNDLVQKGVVSGDFARLYKIEEAIRSLLDQFVEQVDCQILVVGQDLYLIPKTKLSPFHISNEQLKKIYLKSNATNADLYLMYFCTIVLIGSFYNSYHSTEPTRNFISQDQWLSEVNQRIDSLKEHDEEKLKKYEREYSYRWSSLIEKWEALDDIKETASRQSGNTLSRLSFLDTVRRFLIDQGLIEEIGAGEWNITEKTKVIVQRYFMEREFNRGIIEFLYDFEREHTEVNEIASN